MLLLVDRHPQRQKIIDMIVAGRSVREIAASVKPVISHSAIQSYRTNAVLPVVANLSKIEKTLAENGLQASPANIEQTRTAVLENTKQAAASRPIIARIHKHQKTVDSAIVDAQEAKDGRTIAALITTDLKGIELFARLTGQLTDNPTHQTNVQIIIQSGPAAPLDPAATIDIDPAADDS